MGELLCLCTTLSSGMPCLELQELRDTFVSLGMPCLQTWGVWGHPAWELRVLRDTVSVYLGIPCLQPQGQPACELCELGNALRANLGITCL